MSNVVDFQIFGSVDGNDEALAAFGAWLESAPLAVSVSSAIVNDVDYVLPLETRTERMVREEFDPEPER